MTSFIGNLRFFHKFLLLGLLAVSMLALPASLLLRSDLQAIQRAQREVNRATTRSVRQARQLAQAVAAGDLSRQVSVTGRDEVGELLHALAAMNASLAQVVGRVRSNADSVATASTEISQGNLDLSQRSEEQASALQPTASSMEQLGSPCGRTPTTRARPARWRAARATSQRVAARW
ncbi:HAMP domain-containing protein [Eleftheria terrae]|nr:HAMP domain-containing protein [Eleftheria terrae]